MRKNISTFGFTIVELLLVIIAIGILAGITLVQYNGVQAGARDAQRRTDVSNITKALEQYYADNGNYPIGVAPTGSVIGTTWYTSGDASWPIFATSMNGIIDTLPTDPTNTPNGDPRYTPSFVYAYFTGNNWCGHNSGQWYILVYHFESSPVEKFADGDCSANPIGDGYYAAGGSYYRVVK